MAPIADGVLSIRSCVNRWMCFVKQIPRGACAKSSPRANCLHSICISASMHNTTKHTENKREHRGGERTDRPNNKLNHQRLSLTLCVCVCVSKREPESTSRTREMKTNAEGKRKTEGGRENERQREKSNLQEHNKKLYLWQKRTHRSICLAVCTSRILWKFIKLEPFKRMQSSKLYYWGGKRERQKE